MRETGGENIVTVFKHAEMLRNAWLNSFTPSHIPNKVPKLCSRLSCRHVNIATWTAVQTHKKPSSGTNILCIVLMNLPPIPLMVLMVGPIFIGNGSAYEHSVQSTGSRCDNQGLIIGHLSKLIYVHIKRWVKLYNAMIVYVYTPLPSYAMLRVTAVSGDAQKPT